MSKPTLTLTVESVVLAGSTGRVTLHGTAEAVHHLLSHAFRMVAGPWQSGTYGGFHRLADSCASVATIIPRADNTGWRWDGDTYPSVEAAMAAADAALVARGWTLTDGVTP